MKETEGFFLIYLQIQTNGWPGADLVNLGGGLDIPHASPNLAKNGPIAPIDETTPTPENLVQAVLPHLPMRSRLILEPGRSLVATAGELKNC